MNLRKLKNQAGFTLVELIVVIAIMAILAGVAVPVYSGYIEKANKAGDMQLLGAVNSAFAAACIENDVMPTDLADGSVDFDTNTKEVTEYNTEFQKYFAGNESAEFKATPDVIFAGGVFVDPTSAAASGAGVTAITVGGKTAYITESQKQALINSGWGAIGSEGLLDMVDNVSGLAQSIDNKTFEDMLASEGFLSDAMGILGVTGTSQADYELAIFNKANAEAEKALADGKITEDQFEDYRAELAGKINTNTTILVAAQNSNAASKNILATLTSNGGADAKESIKAAMTGENPSEGLAQAALAYSLYNSYMYSKDPENFDPTATLDFSTVMNTITDTGFQNYLNDTDKSGQAQKDLNGYMAAMNAVSNNGDIASDVLVNGFGSDDLTTALQQVIGK